MILTATVNVKDIERMLGAQRAQAPAVAARVANQTIQAVHTTARREIAAYLKVPQRVFNNPRRKRSALAVSKARADRPQATLTALGYKPPLIHFAAKATPAGVTYRLPKGRGPARHAFIATMRSGHRGVFRRRRHTGPVGPSGLAHRLPIDELRGPAIADVFTDQIVGRLEREAQALMPRFLDQALAAAARRRGA